MRGTAVRRQLRRPGQKALHHAFETYPPATQTVCVCIINQQISPSRMPVAACLILLLGQTSIHEGPPWPGALTSSPPSLSLRPDGPAASFVPCIILLFCLPATWHLRPSVAHVSGRCKVAVKGSRRPRRCIVGCLWQRQYGRQARCVKTTKQPRHYPSLCHTQNGKQPAIPR